MMCPVCRHGESHPGSTTVTLERDELTFLAKDVPSMVCATCGEEYLDSSTTELVLRMAEDAARYASRTATLKLTTRDTRRRAARP